MNQNLKHILHITFNMGIGGTEQVIRQIVENSNEDHFRHEILCIDGFIGAIGRQLQEKGIRVESVARESGVDFKLIRKINSIITTRKIDVLHCHQYTPYFYGVIGAVFKKVRIVFTEHGRFFPDKHHFKRRFINPLLAYKTDSIVAISNSTAEALSEYEYISRRRIRTIYNGIRDISNIDEGRNELLTELNLKVGFRYVGTISRIEPIKNQAMMIKAFHQAKKAIPELKLILIGDGVKLGDLKKLVEDLNIVEDVIFTGFLDDPQRYIKFFDLFLLSSFSEGASMTLLEAMSFSKPCVVTKVGGNPELVENFKTGRVVLSDDTNLFASAMVDLLTDDKLRLEYGKNGRKKFLNEFTVSKMTENYQKVYSGVSDHV